MCKSKNRLDGKVALVTGGNTGMGYEAAKDLAARGAKVIIASRNETKLRQAAAQMRSSTGNPYIYYKVFDLASLTSVRHLAHEVNQESRLDILINNAGGIGMPDRLTEDGLNLMMQVNFFGAFLLTYLLLPLLRSSAPSRIINSSAVSMYVGQIDFEHWNDIGRYSIISASGNSKLAAALITAEWGRRLKGTGVTANSFDPFFVRDTEISRHTDENLRFLSDKFLDIVGSAKNEVGEQIAYYASDPELQNVNGKHFKFCGRWPRHWLAQDKELRKKLWSEAKRLVRITPEEDWEAGVQRYYVTHQIHGIRPIITY